MSHSNTLTTPRIHLPMTTHVRTRMQQRGIRPDDVEAALSYGRAINARGMTFFVIGHKEVRKYSARGIDLGNLAGIQVLVSREGAIVTTYRSHDFHAIKSSSRPQRRVRAMNNSLNH